LEFLDFQSDFQSEKQMTKEFLKTFDENSHRKSTTGNRIFEELFSHQFC
jgi:hypothetical protein